MAGHASYALVHERVILMCVLQGQLINLVYFRDAGASSAATAHTFCAVSSGTRSSLISSDW
jgi:hypothetical protein